MSENDHRDARAGDYDGEDAGGAGPGGATEESTAGAPALAGMSPRERRNYERDQRKRRQEAAKRRRAAIREEARRRRAGAPVEEVERVGGAAQGAGPGPVQPVAGASVAAAADESIDTGDFADPDAGEAEGAAPTADLSKLSRKERRELRKRQRAELREAAKRERLGALGGEQGDSPPDDDDGSPQADHEDQGPAPTGDAQTSAEQESDVADPGSNELQTPIVPKTPSEQAAADRIEAASQREEEALGEASEQEASASADRRVREVQQIQRVAEQGAAEAAMGAHVWRPGAELDEEGHPVAPFADELKATELHIRSRRQRDQELVEELDATEVRIGETRERTQQAIEDAERRLEEIQSQAAEAEERASRAEQIAEYKQAESEREHRLLEMLEKINEAERRAREAEARARQAVADVARPLEPLKGPSPLPPTAPASIEDLKSRPFDPSAPEGDGGRGVEGEALDDDAPVNINEGSFEQLRAVGLSVTQVGRLLAVRERTGGFSSIEELDSIPGFPREFLDSVRDRLQV